DGELKLMRPQSTRDRRGCEAMPFAEKQQDIRRLRDDELAGLQKRRRERRTCELFVIETRKHCVLAVVRPCDVDIAHRGFLERQAHEFAAALDRRPVVELVNHTKRVYRWERNFSACSMNACGFSIW